MTTVSTPKEGLDGAVERTAALTTTGLRVSYGEVVAVQDVALSAQPGRFIAVTGPSGAGKSSLLWALAGALRPSGGEVRYGEVALTGRAEAAALGISLIPQGNALVGSLTARENLLVPLFATGVHASEAAGRAEAALGEVGLEESADHLIEELSGGQQQRVAVARALALDSAVLLADEPTSDLDSGNRERVIEALRRRAAAGAVVVMSTHDPEAAARADAVLALDEGRMTWRRSEPSNRQS